MPRQLIQTPIKCELCRVYSGFTAALLFLESVCVGWAVCAYLGCDVAIFVSVFLVPHTNWRRLCQPTFSPNTLVRLFAYLIEYVGNNSLRPFLVFPLSFPGQFRLNCIHFELKILREV